MFRATQANPFDQVVVKATDENLTSENWEYILDVCDKVTTEDTGGKDAAAALIKRLAHRNANVQLYTLELANALSQNCGLKIHKELASRSFTDAMLRLAADRNTHQQVKAKILERMGEWTEMFAKDSDLGIMEQAYLRLRSQNPALHPPSKPYKQQITDSDRQKEEEELQMALALSVKDKAGQNQAQKQSQASSSSQAGPSQGQAPTQQVPSGTTAATVSRVRALYDFQPSEPGELQFRRGDIIAVLESVYKDWWKGSLRGQTGIFPLNYIEKLQDPTQEEIDRDAQTEAEVFGEIKNVEKLLTLLSTSSSEMNVRDNEEITSLYHSTLSIRPKLIELIGKYSQKKDDFTQLNEKFIKARRDYEALLEASMSHPAQPYHGRPSTAQNAYGYPPAGGAGGPPSQGYGAAPPQQSDPHNYYSSQPPAQQEPSYPPQNGPAPFYMIPPSQQQHAAPASTQPASTPTPKPNSPGPYPIQPIQPAQPPPQRQSVASAQELAASPYEPTHPTSSYPPAASSTSGHSAPEDSAYPPVQPSFAPPQVPTAAGTPPPPHGGYGGPGGGGYQAYAPPSGGRYGPGPSAVGAGGARAEEDVSDYYR